MTNQSGFQKQELSFGYYLLCRLPLIIIQGSCLHVTIRETGFEFAGMALWQACRPGCEPPVLTKNLTWLFVSLTPVLGLVWGRGGDRQTQHRKFSLKLWFLQNPKENLPHYKVKWVFPPYKNSPLIPQGYLPQKSNDNKIIVIPIPWASRITKQLMLYFNVF